MREESNFERKERKNFEECTMDEKMLSSYFIIDVVKIMFKIKNNSY